MIVFQVYDYIIDVETILSDVALIEQLRETLDNTSFPIQLSNVIAITEISIIFPSEIMTLNHVTLTFVSYSVSQGQVEHMLNFPLFFTELYEYQINIEVGNVNVSQLREVLSDIMFPVQISELMTISDIDMTTGTCYYCVMTFVCSVYSVYFQYFLKKNKNKKKIV